MSSKYIPVNKAINTAPRIECTWTAEGSLSLNPLKVSGDTLTVNWQGKA